MQYKVYANGDDIWRVFGSDSPFNLKSDEKSMRGDEIRRIEKEIADILESRSLGESFKSMRYSSLTRDIMLAKIRVSDPMRNKGKSNGYRCIVLVDRCNYLGFVLHIYRHGHGEDKNISQSEKNSVNKLLEQYALKVKH